MVSLFFFQLRSGTLRVLPLDAMCFFFLSPSAVLPLFFSDRNVYPLSNARVKKIIYEESFETGNFCNVEEKVN